MKNQIILNKKTLTKLLYARFRKSILQSYRKDIYGINDYARYLCDAQIIQRMQGYENDAKSGWGFPQINVICCERTDGSIDKKFFEFNSVNHFLKDQNGNDAIEVLKCILILWLKSEKRTIKSFDYEKIDAELVRLDKEIAEKQAKEQKINETGAKIKDIVQPVIDQAKSKPYSEIAQSTKVKIEKLLEEFKKVNQISSYVVSLDRNNEHTIEKNIFFIDIGFKLDEADDYTILVCNVIPDYLKIDNEKTSNDIQ